MTIYSKAPFKHVTEFTNLTTEELFATPEFKAAVATSASGGLEGTNYIFVAANGTDVENAAELQAAYVTAQGMSPDFDNRITIVAAPGNYNFGSTTFVLDTAYINLVSLDGNRSIIFNSSNINGTILIIIDSIYVRGIDVENKPFKIETYYGFTVENCKGGNNSFSSTTGFNINQKFIDCEGGDFSFGGDTNGAFGEFIRCKAGNNSFGLTASGTYTDCTAGNNSFGNNGTANGRFINCVGNSRCFGYFGNASGIFNNCESKFAESFGYAGIASGTFTNCKGANSSFAYAGTASGIFTNCIATEDSFGAYTGGALSGVAQYCVASNFSFGSGPSGFQGTLDGYLYFCRLTNGTFRTVSGAGKTRLCIDGNNAENNQG